MALALARTSQGCPVVPPQQVAAHALPAISPTDTLELSAVASAGGRGLHSHVPSSMAASSAAPPVPPRASSESCASSAKPAASARASAGTRHSGASQRAPASARQATPAPAPAPAPARAPAPAPEPPLQPPEHVDADLQDKPVAVQIAVMARREREKRELEARVAAVAEKERNTAAELAAIDEARARLQDKIRAWSHEPSGAPRNIRALIVNMDSVLWEGHSWTAPTMGQLVVDAKLRVAYLKACRVVHPDKLSTDVSAEHKYIAKAVFHALNEAWKVHSGDA